MGPKEQLSPTAAAPRDCRVITAGSRRAPVRASPSRSTVRDSSTGQTGLPAGQQRRTGLRKPGQCFADQQIRAALLQSGRLDSVGIHQPVKGNPVAVPVFGVDREPHPGQIPRDQHAAAGRFLFSGPAGQEKQPPIGVAQFVR